MPSTSARQHNFMEMSKSAAGRRALRAHGRKPAPAGVASEFTSADKGKHFTKKKFKGKNNG